MAWAGDDEGIRSALVKWCGPADHTDLGALRDRATT
ncbi:hypothetical protein [Streptosporangium soli]